MQCLLQKTRESPSVGCDIGRDFFPEKLGADPESQEKANKQTKQKAKQQCGVILTPSSLVVGSQHIYAQRVIWGCRLNTTWSHPLPPQLTLPLRWRRHDWLRLLTWSPSALLPAPRSWTLCLLCPNLQALTRNKGHAPWVWAHRLLGYNSHVLTVFNSYKC